MPRSTTGWTHEFLVKIACWALWEWMREVRVVNEGNLPRQGPVIVASTHHNSALDPTTLSTTYPSGRRFHYWVKATLFKNPIARAILLDAGNIPVDRENKDKRQLFQGTIDVLAAGEAVAVFPEGTSYTEPRIIQVKDGVAWSALEYASLSLEQPEKKMPPLVIIPTAIVYTNKSKYRTAVIMEFGTPIKPEDYVDAYMSTTTSESAKRTATKNLTREIERQMVQMSVNAPDWETLNAARMAREILWEDERSIPLDDFVVISQTLVDLFTPPYAAPQIESLKTCLLTYYALLNTTHLTHYALSSLPLPLTLDPQRPVPLPSRLSTLKDLLFDSLACLIRLPFFLLPLLVHMPVYIVGRFMSSLIQDEEEVAQSKVFLGLFILFVIYPTLFFALWAFLRLKPVGAVVAALVVWAFAVYHVRLVDENYNSAKRLVAAWRVLVGVWAPQSWDIALSSVQLSARPYQQAENKWVKKPSSGGSTMPKPPTPQPTKKEKKKKLPPSRRLVRHVLRGRVLAAQSLFGFLDELERSEWRVTASPHLARVYGHAVDESSMQDGQQDQSKGAEDVTHAGDAVPEPNGWRSGKEVVLFLRGRGAKFGMGRKEGGDWGLSSGEEGEETGDGEENGDTDASGVWVSGDASGSGR